MNDIMLKTYTSRGYTGTAKELCDRFKIPYHVFAWRLKNKGYRSLFRPVGVLVEFNGVLSTSDMIAAASGVRPKTIAERIRKGCPADELGRPVVSSCVRAGKGRPENGKPVSGEADFLVSVSHDRAVRSKQIKECKAHLRALVRHHPEIGRRNLIEGLVAKKRVAETGTPARTAHILASHGRGHLVTQNDIMSLSL